jgi:AI-2 transport protein TqsA
MGETSSTSNPVPADSTAPGWFHFVVTSAILLGLIRLGREFLVPLVVATLLFILALAITERIGSLSIGGRRPPKWLARLLSVGLVLFAFLAIGAIASGQAGAISQAAPRYAERLQALAGTAKELVGADIASALQRAIASVDIGAWLSTAIQSLGGAIGTVFLVLLYVAFMAAEHGAFREKLPRLCASEAEADHLARLLRSISTRVQSYIWITTLVSAMSAAAAFVILKWVGVNFALTFALVVFLVKFIPTIGSIIAVAATSLMALLEFDTITPFFLVLVVYTSIDSIIGLLILPALQGKSLNLSPLMGMVALAFWGIMWGTVGAFLAVPMTVATMIICAEFPRLRPFAVLLSSDGELPNAGRS